MQLPWLIPLGFDYRMSRNPVVGLAGCCSRQSVQDSCLVISLYVLRRNAAFIVFLFSKRGLCGGAFCRLVHVQCVQKYAIYSEETLPAACPDRVMMTGESTYACSDGSANTGIYNWAPSVRLTLVFEDDFESGQKAEHPSVNKARDECMPSTGRDALPDGVCRWEMEISEAEATKLCTLLRAL